MPTASLNSYLFFSGRCEEAIEFYKKGLGATLEFAMKFDESPSPPPPGTLQPGFEKKIMHAEIKIGDSRLMMSDGCDDKSKFDGFRLVLTVTTETEAHKAFDALAAGGTVDMPLSKTFWSPCYGMVTDKFKVGWMVMVPGEPPK